MYLSPRLSRLALVAAVVMSLGATAIPEAAYAKDKNKHHRHDRDRDRDRGRDRDRDNDRGRDRDRDRDWSRRRGGSDRDWSRGRGRDRDRIVYYTPPVVYARPPACYSPGYVYAPRYHAPRSGVTISFRLTNVAPSGYDYYDPYCERQFNSLDVYVTHLHRHSHPQVVQVIDEDYGYPNYAYGRRGGSWVRFGVQGDLKF